MHKLAALPILALAHAAAAATPAPELFAPGVISGPGNDGSPTFTPDGNTLYFTRSAGGWSVILESHRAKGTWSEPAVASFSGEYSDSSPGLAPDGSYIVFVSLRPKPQLYRANRTAAGWSKPEVLPAEVNIGPSIWKPSVAADGTIYFVSIDTKGGKRLYAAARKGTGYAPAQPLPFSDGTTGDVDPEILPDGSRLVFCSSGRIKDDPRDHLYMVRRTATGWGAIEPVHFAGDGKSTDEEPHLGPDRKTIFFASDRAPSVTFPRTREQAISDVKRLEAYDNGMLNVWSIPLPA